MASSNPAVSMAVNFTGPILASPSRKSRVTPGWLSTKASRLPTRRLKSVDFPTFGRPTSATVKVIFLAFYENVIKLFKYITIFVCL